MREEAVRIARFLAGGVVNTAIGGGAILALQWAGFEPHVANAGGYAVGIPCGYLINRLFVFKRYDPPAGRAVRYLGAIAFAFLFNQFVLSFLTAFSEAGSPALAQLAALATYTATMFLLCRFWVFADRGTTAGSLSSQPL
jgi:putative flippase GtrA